MIGLLCVFLVFPSSWSPSSERIVATNLPVSERNLVSEVYTLDPVEVEDGTLERYVIRTNPPVVENDEQGNYCHKAGS